MALPDGSSILRHCSRDSEKIAVRSPAVGRLDLSRATQTMLESSRNQPKPAKNDARRFEVEDYT